MVVDVAENVYPVELLEGMSTAFVGFAGGNYGRQDCAFMQQAGLEAVCVEKDPARLHQLRESYPAGWQFVEADVYEYARMRYAQGARWDVVSLDPFTTQFQEAADQLPLWCKLSRRYVILGTGLTTRRRIPSGWVRVGRWNRSSYKGGVYWIALRKGKA